MPQILVLLMALLLVGCGGDPVGRDDPKTQPPPDTVPAVVPGRWAARAPMPTSRQEMPAAALDGRVFVVGGMDAQIASLPTLEIYDPATNTWTAGPAMPAGRHHHGVAATNGKLYVVGGFETGGQYPWDPVRDVFAFDPVEGTWTRKASLSGARGALAAVAFGGKVYAIGGESDGATARLEVYDPTTDRWTLLAPMPTAREHLAAVEIGGKIYAVGGRVTKDHTRWAATTTNLPTIEVYDPATDQWTTRTPMPTARGGLAAAAVGGKLYVFGGESPSEVFTQVEEYEPATDRWRTMAQMPNPRHGHGAATVGEWIYAVGGGIVPAYSHSALNEAFSPR